MAAAAKKVNWFPILISAIVIVVVVAIVILVDFMNNKATAPAAAPASGAVDSSTGAITIGEGSDTLDTYIDFMCPYCGDFEESWGDDISTAVADGDLTLVVHPVSILDNSSQGTQYSTRAANALYCVTDTNGDAAYPFIKELYDNQPDEGSTGLTDDELIGYAKDVDAADAASCITDRTYDDLVSQTTETLPTNSAGKKSTPTVLFNGDEVNYQSSTLADYLGK